MMGLILINSTVLANTKNTCDDIALEQRLSDGWGSEVDVAYRGDITFYKETAHQVEDFTLNVEEYGGFECPADEIKLEKVSKSCLLISVSWYPGADSSGCDIKLSRKGQDLGTSTLFMSY